jgi:hypothetical protein
LHFWEVHGSSTCFFFPNVSRKYYQCYLYLFFWPEKSVDRRCVFRMPIRKIIAFNVQSWEVVILPCKTKNYSLVCLLKWYLKLPNYLAINHKYERRGLTLLVLFTGGVWTLHSSEATIARWMAQGVIQCLCRKNLVLFWPPTLPNADNLYPKHRQKWGIFVTTYLPALVYIDIECPPKPRSRTKDQRSVLIFNKMAGQIA